MLFRELSAKENEGFQDYATNNDPPDLDKWDLYHPVCREVWCNRGVCPHPAHKRKVDLAS